MVAGEVQTWGLAEGGRLGHQDAAHHLDAFFPTQRPQAVRALPRDLPVTQVGRQAGRHKGERR